MNMRIFEARVKKVLGNRLSSITYTKRVDKRTKGLQWDIIYVHTIGASEDIPCRVAHSFEAMIKLLEATYDITTI